MNKSTLIILPIALLLVFILIFACSDNNSVQPQATVPDMSNFGFSNVLATSGFVPGTPDTIDPGEITVIIPPDAFSEEVTFDILTGNPANFASTAPAGMEPIYAIAFQVTNKQTGDLIGTFDNPVSLEVINPDITMESRYYNFSTDSTYTLNMTGISLQPGQLKHEISTAEVGWVITNPTVFDWTLHGFPNILVTQNFQPGIADTVATLPYELTLPANALDTLSSISILTGDTATFEAMAPSGEIPIFAFALGIRNLESDHQVANFNNPAMMTITSSKITVQAKYYNVGVDGSFTENPTGLQVSKGMLSHPIAGATSGWVITVPGIPDWALLGFPLVYIERTVTSGVADSFKVDPYSVVVPADAFSQDVDFELLTGDVSLFMDNVPAGETPVFAFAMRVYVQGTLDLVGDFENPVTLIIDSPTITAQSKYYNISTDGTYTLNPTGLQVMDGLLSHPIAGATSGWVVTNPSP